MAFVKAKSLLRPNIKLIGYLDQIYTSQKIEHIKFLNDNLDNIFVLSNMWKTLLYEQGFRKPIGIMPYGFDSQNIYPLDKQDVRTKMGVNSDEFLIVNVNRNTFRKRYDLVIMSFVECVARNPQAKVKLLCVCDKGQRGGYSIDEIYIRELKKHNLLVEDHIGKIIMVSQDQCHSDEIINSFYSAADVGLTCADAEGFGLCTFEMMGLGIAQIVPKLVGFLEYCNSANSIILPTKTSYYVPNSISPIGGEAHSVDPVDVAVAIETYMNDRALLNKHSVAAAHTVNDYKWNVVMRDFIQNIRLS
jgi:glycosyltransferase involved in cell wall biosynthesis